MIRTRKLITFDTTAEEDEAILDGEDDEEYSTAPAVEVRTCNAHIDSEFAKAAGVSYQRCGGGRRVIRKHKGAY